ncbi:glycosyltransferase [Halobacteriovorax sp. GB3]|uniref:glycosyltransferase n=1 Tax=Halobacteriovorax sp. GB3 TaxID=2719615 RepID=UPI0023628215|nr:glycosyltransferase [Halobacteriovorax sp. GB3]MDD0852522.1 glycosyltransferase [Halobacteriovorax sp. GB3]
MEKKIRVCVAVPMFNESMGAERCIRTIHQWCSSIENADVQLLVVEDGSSDNTLEVLQKLKSEIGFILVVHESNKGYGQALSSANKVAYKNGFEYIIHLDSDLTNDPKDIPRFIEKMYEGYDFIKATRYKGGGRVEGVPFKRWVISWIGNIVASKLFGLGLSDCTNGYRAIKLEYIHDFDFQENRFPSIMEELYFLKKRKLNFIEIPVTLYTRDCDQRGSSFVYQPHVFWSYLKYPIKGLLKEYAEMGPNKARLLYDLLAISFLSFFLFTILKLFNVAVSVYELYFSCLFLLTGAWSFGIYGRNGEASSVKKSLLFLMVFVALITLGSVLFENQLFFFLFSLLLFPVVTLPRIFLNLAPHISSEILAPIVLKNAPVLLVGAVEKYGENLIDFLISNGVKVRLLEKNKGTCDSVLSRFGENVEVVHGEIGHVGCALKSIRGVQSVFFFTDSNSSNEKQKIEDDILSMHAFLEMLAILKIPKFYFFSSLAVYSEAIGKEKKLCDERTVINSTDSNVDRLINYEKLVLSNMKIPLVSVLRIGSFVKGDSIEEDVRKKIIGQLPVDEMQKLLLNILEANSRDLNREIINFGCTATKNSEKSVSFEKALSIFGNIKQMER